MPAHERIRTVIGPGGVQARKAWREAGTGIHVAALAVAVAAWGLSGALPARAWGGKVELKRRYQPGQKLVYTTNMHTRAQIQSDPPGLKDLLPPMPTEFSVQQQTTLTVQGIHPDGSVDMQDHFDQFEVRSDLTEKLPENLRDTARETEQELNRTMAGQALTAHYDSQGRLVGLEGVEALLDKFDPALREPLRQALRLMLEHTVDTSLYPDHKVKRGEEWKRKLDAEASADYPFQMQGESTSRFAGTTRFRGAKAAIVEFRFTNMLTPALEQLRQTSPLGQLEAHGLGLDIRINGQGEGRALLALQDGRVLETQSKVHQNMSARLTNPGHLSLPTSQPVKLQIQSDTEMHVETAGK